MASGFLYFLPGCRGTATEEMIAEHGLGYIIDQPGEEVRSREATNNHIVGSGGLVVGNLDWPEEEVKQSDQLEWIPFPKSHAPKQPWLGWYKGRMPRPADLRRKVGAIEGEYLRLADGDLWEVPIARDFAGSCLLPRCYDLDNETGAWVPKKVRREYTRLWDRAFGIFTAKIEAYEQAVNGSQEGKPLTFSFAIDNAESLVADVLSVNYRVSNRELATMGVLVDGLVQQLADIIIDHHPNSKKKLADAGSESNG